MKQCLLLVRQRIKSQFQGLKINPQLASQFLIVPAPSDLFDKIAKTDKPQQLSSVTLDPFYT